MHDLVFAIPGDLDAPTGGYEYARRLLRHLPDAGIAVRPLMLPGSFPMPCSADLAATAAAFADLPDGVPLIVDGLAYGALPTDVIAAVGSRALVALVHHPLGLEEGLAAEMREALLASERAALALATRVLVTSPYTGRLLVERFGVPPGRIDVAMPGTELRAALPRNLTQNAGRRGERPPPPPFGRSPSPCGGGGEAAPFASPPPQGEGDHAQHGGGGWLAHSGGGEANLRPHSQNENSGPANLLAIGAVTPRKGFDVLVRALARLGDMPWRLTIAGSLERSPAHVAQLRSLTEEAGLGDRVRLAGAVSDAELQRLYGEADILVSSSLFEGYGMTLAEALARGLPIVMARGGAADETVPDAAALKVPPGDADALAQALRRVLVDRGLPERLAAASRAAGEALPRWPDTAAIVAAAVRQAVEDPSP